MIAERLAMGVERGEIDAATADTQADLLFDVLAGTLLHRMLVRGEDVDDAFVVVDPRGGEVHLDGERLAMDPVQQVPLSRLYFL